MNDPISRQAAIDARRYTFGNDEFSLEAAYHDCKLVFDGITDEDSFQEADTGLILYYANEIIYALQEALDKDTNVPSNDCISRQAAIDALKEHRALYCDNTPDTFSKLSYAEKSRVDELDTAIATLVNLPSAQPELTENWWKTDHGYMWLCPHCGLPVHSDFEECLRCGIKRQSAQQERKKGKWIKLDMHAHLADHKCSACEQECYVPTCMGDPMYVFCPNCGAEMER